MAGELGSTKEQWTTEEPTVDVLVKILIAQALGEEPTERELRKGLAKYKDVTWQNISDKIITGKNSEELARALDMVNDALNNPQLSPRGVSMLDYSRKRIKEVLYHVNVAA